MGIYESEIERDPTLLLTRFYDDINPDYPSLKLRKVKCHRSYQSMEKSAESYALARRAKSGDAKKS